ncbi:uncharacterized protein LOC108117559 [Drosophila eugracilis]|uniref:uncharacterized protein LOC108117559 n=1 Tax=Drosophila eugracilis TaxID=29029 RepID=UPI0007E6B3E0|nr:uncharacterized protein LOC108117559 [Drosophila eugracilis]
MQLLAVTLVLVLASLAQCRPTFDKIAEVLLGALDDQPKYYPPGRALPGEAYVHPHPGPGPLIQEGYQQGYDYHYGGGYGYGGYQQTHPAGYGYYPAPRPTTYYPPQQSLPLPAYYSQPTPSSPGYYPHKTQDIYGGGYKQRGY